MKTIITRDLIPEAPGSRFPRVNLTFDEAVAEAAKIGGRLPTEQEVLRLFELDPWPHVALSWTTTPASRDRKVLRGGAWNDPCEYARASNRLDVDPTGRYGSVGFFVVREIEDDASVPEGWVTL